MAGERVAHLGIIVDLLDQSSRTSSFAKRLGVSFAAVFLALGTEQAGFRISYLAIFPLLFLWILDAQNTRRDFLLHALYNDARGREDSRVDFSIDLEALPEARKSTLAFFLSPNPALFYLAMLVGIGTVDYLIN